MLYFAARSNAMNIDLFEHNQRAYEAAVLMMEQTGKAAIIHPTGTGKSLIAFKLALDNPNKSICWLAPSSYIYHTQLENLQMITDTHSSDPQSPDNITFISYSKLMHNENLIDEIEPDYIVLDEFHRCGAAEWGKSVRKLLDTHKTAKILGLSATNIRYLDNQRDMAQEIFGGCIASEMTLGEAMTRGILSTPKYVMAMYSYGDELKKLEQRIRTMEKQSDSKKNLELLEQLRRALEKADGPDKIFAKHMRHEGKKNGKYIVFCSGREHMDEMVSHMNEWFGLVDQDPHMYVAYYNNPEVIEFPSVYSHYYRLHYNDQTGVFLFPEDRTDVIEFENDLSGYFCIITSENMDAKAALNLYKSRDTSEKLFRGDKSYLGDKSLRVYGDSAADSKIFIEFLALIVRNRMYNCLKDEMLKLDSRPNYMTVPAAIRELEKIEMVRLTDNKYRLDHAVTATQKTILKAFGIDTALVKYYAEGISKILREEK